MFEPIAILGMGMRLPGQVHNAADYWDLLVNGRNGHCRVPSSRYNVNTWYGTGRAGHVASEFGYFLDGLDLAHIDASFWSFSKQEAELMDPQQRLLLEVVYEAFENSGAANLKGKDVGVYVGIMGDDWMELDFRDEQKDYPVRADVFGDYILANRVSYEFDLKGPSIVTRTACSSSLVALHQACQDLQGGVCTSAIVGGVNIILSPRATIAMTEQGVLSSTGVCRSFDADADGYGRGEGVCAIYLKKLTEAVRDGDSIRAVIKSTCVGSDGRTQGMTVPDPVSHERLIRRAYHMAGVSDLSKTAMVECHGTGTSVGDPLEVSAVANIWPEGVYIGSVKPNIGHGEGASGLSSIIKMVLALEHSTIPPNINFKTPNPRISWKDSKLTVPIQALPWPADRLQRVSVNSFGIGGTNAHAILESATSVGIRRSRHREQMVDAPKPQLLIFTATCVEALKSLASQLENYSAAYPARLGDLAYSLATRRDIHSHRAFSVTTGTGPFELSQINKPKGSSSDLIWVFTGQGAQWPQMGQGLLEAYPLVQQRIGDLDTILSQLPDPPPWTIKELLLAPKEKSRLHEAEFSQPCLAALQIALVDLLHSWSIMPTAVVGHSSGETAAAYAAGAISAEHAILLAYHRGQITPALRKAHNGSMAAIGLGRGQVEPFLRPGVMIGCENSPANVTLSGEIDALEDVMNDIRSQHPDVLVRPLHVECAYHSTHMEAVRADYQSRVDHLTGMKRPQIPCYSSVTGVRNYDMAPSYWVRNIMSPVLFKTAMETVLDNFASPTFLEIGPHSALAGPIRQILSRRGHQSPYIPTLVRKEDGVSCILKTAGELWLSGLDIDLGSVTQPGELLTDLPTYPWHHDREYWTRSRLSHEWRFRQHAHHELLGYRVLETGDAAPAWRCKLRVADVPWLRDHEIQGEVILPATGYVSMVGEAMRQLATTGLPGYMVSRVTFLEPLVVTDEAVEIITTLSPSNSAPAQSEWHNFSVSSLGRHGHTKHVSGRCRPASGPGTSAPEIQSLPRKVSATAFYDMLKKYGIRYGPTFRGLSNITSHVTETTALGTVDTGDSIDQRGMYAVHPATFDASLHICMAAECYGLESKFGGPSIPKYIEEAYVGSPRGPMTVTGAIRSNGKAGSVASITGVSQGRIAIHVQGLETVPLNIVPHTVDEDPHAGAILEWKPDVDFLNLGNLVQQGFNESDVYNVLEKMALACMIQSRKKVRDLNAVQPHLIKFRDWLGESSFEGVVHSDGHPTGKTEDTRLIAGDTSGYNIDVPEYAEVVSMGKLAREALIQGILASCVGTEAEGFARAIYQLHANFTAFFEGCYDLSNFLMKDDRSIQSWSCWDDTRQTDLLKVLGHKKPVMRVLHIGKSSTSRTERQLQALQSTYGERMYSSYVYTDASESALSDARMRFKDFSAVEYALLDIAEDPIAQGFKKESFDLVIATNLELSGCFTTKALQNIRKLLSRGGRLILQQSRATSRAVAFVLGALPQWWMNEVDIYGVLERAGYDENSATIWEGSMSATISCMPAVEPPKTAHLSILCHDSGAIQVAELSSFLTDQGFELEFFTLGQNLPVDQFVVSLLDIKSPFLNDVTESQYSAFKKSILSIQEAAILWVTGASQIRCKNPNYSLILGVVRSLRRELGLNIVTLELDSFSRDGWHAVTSIVANMIQHSNGHGVILDTEYVFDEGTLYVGRFHSIKVSQELQEHSSEESAKRLSATKARGINGLFWEQFDPIPIAMRQIEVEVKAVGLNDEDMVSVNREFASKGEGEGQFGLEGCGIVRSVGPEVQHLQPGDRVVFSSSGCLSSHITLSEDRCVKLTDSISFSQAASIPYAYGIAMYALSEMGKLRTGQSILITQPCTAVGQAAIQVAQMLEAQVFCTPVSAEELAYLTSNFAVPETQIFDSNDMITSRILEATSGSGVDLVLNSFIGDMMSASWQCVAPFGTLVQFGNKDQSDGSCSSGVVDLMDHSRVFMRLDFAQLMAHRPLVCARMLARVCELHDTAKIRNVLPIKTYKASEVVEAFRDLQNGPAIGKIVIEMTGKTEDLEAKSPHRKTVLRPDRAYILVGGLGGLGQATARFLVEQGARHLLFFSRSAHTFPERHPEYLKELQAYGCNVQFTSGSVDDMADVMKVISLATVPIAGILNAAMSLQDASFGDMTFDQWRTSLQPKVKGTWNLHHALQSQPKHKLDFFFLFSSLSGLGGQIGQANYAAGNAFLDAFVQYRHSLGLPCSVLDIGIMEDIGVLARETQRLDALRATTAHVLHEQELLDGIELMLGRSQGPVHSHDDSPSGVARSYINRSQVALGMRSTLSLASPLNRTGWRQDARALFWWNTETNVDPLESVDERKAMMSLKQFLYDCGSDPTVLKTNEAALFLAEEISKTLQGFMMRNSEDIVLDAPLTAIGVDSLIIVELRNWLRHKVGVQLSVSEIRGSKTIQGLGSLAAERLYKMKHGSA
ncbi:beta-ketoacyl synthase domain-containing protein [Xylariales sp. AK1849]|nr:beta-ketoacyl synthase domain-containing protein [Xylariales sp. AK1849]